MRVIARVHSDFSSKFGVPRQSGLVEDLESTLVFEPEFRSEDALRGLEDFSHLWLVWVFHQAARGEWSPTVRPPRLGGNARLGVFATRSPFRPNPIALSAVRLAGVERTAGQGTVLRLRGADLVDGTPVLDIKPYLPYADCVPGALGGFAAAPAGEVTRAIFPGYSGRGCLLASSNSPSASRRRRSCSNASSNAPRPSCTSSAQ